LQIEKDEFVFNIEEAKQVLSGFQKDLQPQSEATLQPDQSEANVPSSLLLTPREISDKFKEHLSEIESLILQAKEQKRKAEAIKGTKTRLNSRIEQREEAVAEGESIHFNAVLTMNDTYKSQAVEQLRIATFEHNRMQGIVSKIKEFRKGEELRSKRVLNKVHS
jgi:hypothetical protein